MRRRDATSSERRRHGRREVEDASLSNPMVRGRIVNRSSSGLAIESHEALRIGVRYAFTVSSGEEQTRLEGTVLWCRLASTRLGSNGDVTPVYRAGIAVEGE